MKNTIEKYTATKRLFDTKAVLDSLIESLEMEGLEPEDKDRDFSLLINKEYRETLGLGDLDGIYEDFEADYLKGLELEIDGIVTP